MSKKHFSKKPFILLEVFLAIALLALCLIPIASSPFRHFLKQTKALKQMELERLNDVAYRDFLHELPSITTFQDLPASKEGALHHLMGPYTFRVEECGDYSYQASFSYWIVAPKKVENHALLRIQLKWIPEEEGGFSPEATIYDLFIEKKST